MQLTLLPRENGVIIRVEEKRLDAAVATAFKDRVRNLVADAGPCVTLDLGPVDFMDSSGLGAVIAIYKAMPPGSSLDLVGVTPNVERVFRLTRMDTILTIHLAPPPVPGAAPGHVAGPAE
ncbi:STAS domain-containing protein [Paracoccus yeei]|uniref:STAS domain-containing protein n=1 Tax=Paracoccus yeei TaxID=147645 RepID=UPI000688050D|nr:STAS domain-containing protein [Paracoccus yeei]OWJ97379.1 anti-sigma factor antagonist [Paracoccus yeei]